MACPSSDSVSGTIRTHLGMRLPPSQSETKQSPLNLEIERAAPPFQYIREMALRAQTSDRFSALTLPRILSALTSNETFWPSARPERPARSTALTCTKTSFPPSLGWIKPKPFWPLNHLTVPVAIFFSKAYPRVTITRFHSTGRCLWEGARRRIHKGTAANRISEIYGFSQQNTSKRRNPYDVCPRSACRSSPFGHPGQARYQRR